MKTLWEQKAHPDIYDEDVREEGWCDGWKGLPMQEDMAFFLTYRLGYEDGMFSKMESQ